MNAEIADKSSEGLIVPDTDLLLPVDVPGEGTTWRRKPTKREMEAAAIEATALANESGILIQQLSSVVNQLLTERKQMDAAVDKLDGDHDAIYELRRMRLEE